MIKRFQNEEEGATMVEYGLMVALIAVACIAAITTLSGGIQNIFTTTDAKLDSASNPQ